MASEAVARRGYQDFMSWQVFGTQSLWRDIRTSPALAHELIVQFLSVKLGLRNPSEQTSGDVASAIVVAMHGPVRAATMNDKDIQTMYDWVKATSYMKSPPAFNDKSAVTTACNIHPIIHT